MIDDRGVGTHLIEFPEHLKRSRVAREAFIGTAAS